MRPFLAALAVLALGACSRADAPDATAPAPDSTASAPDPLAGGTTVAALVATTPELASLAALVQRAGLEATLADTARAWTLFAPTNDAVAASDLETLAPDALRDRLLGHVVSTRLFASDTADDLTVETAAGTEVALGGTAGAVTVRAGGTAARIVAPDLDAENGVVHTLDTVLPAP